MVEDKPKQTPVEEVTEVVEEVVEVLTAVVEETNEVVEDQPVEDSPLPEEKPKSLFANLRKPQNG
ncbi:hypothetical protein D3C85_1849760 [compost metagenome]